jgi:hypothetical protein
MKKLYKLFVAVFLFSIATQLSAQTYCYPTWSSTCIALPMTIVSFYTGGASSPQITNPYTPCAANIDANDSYFPNMIASGIPGAVINFTYKTSPAYFTNFRIWVDWNHDGTFNGTDEMVHYKENISANTNVSGSFTIPTNAPLGRTRLRVITVYSYSTLGPTDACTAQPYGELQDYGFYVYSPITTIPFSGFEYDIATDTAWVNNSYMFINTSTNALRSYWDILSYSPTYDGTYTPYNPPASTRVCAARWNTCYLDTVDQNFLWKFTQTGYYKIKLKTANIAAINGANITGVDSITKLSFAHLPLKNLKQVFLARVQL